MRTLFVRKEKKNKDFIQWFLLFRLSKLPFTKVTQRMQCQFPCRLWRVRKLMDFIKIIIYLCSEDQWRSYGFGTTWGWDTFFWVNFPFNSEKELVSFCTMVVCILSSTNCCRRERISPPIAWGNTHQYTNKQSNSLTIMSMFWFRKKTTLDKTPFYICIYNLFTFVPQNNTIWFKKISSCGVSLKSCLFFNSDGACSAASCLAQKHFLLQKH